MILGVVLAGGRSSRFGSDKARAMLAGRTLADHARDLLAPHADRVVIADHGADISDRPRGGLGPLGGIAGALEYAAHAGFASVLTIACDMPNLPDGLIARIAATPGSYCPDAPVLGHWWIAHRDALIADLERGTDRSVRRWAHRIGAVAIPSPASIANINTPQDLLAL